MFFTVKVRNESGFGEAGQWCAFERDYNGIKYFVYNDDGTQLCGDPIVTALNIISIFVVSYGFLLYFIVSYCILCYFDIDFMPFYFFEC